MELFDTLCIPIFHESVVTVDLQLIGFAIVVLLNLISSVVNIFALFMINILYNDRRRILLLFNFMNVVIEFFVFLHVPVIKEIELIVYHNSKSFRMGSLSNNRIQCGKELVIAVRGNANENLPITRNRM